MLTSHTHIHTCTHRHFFIVTNSYTHSCTYRHIPIYTVLQVHTYTLLYMLIFTNLCSIHTFTHMHAHAYKTCTHPHFNSCAYTHSLTHRRKTHKHQLSHTDTYKLMDIHIHTILTHVHTHKINKKNDALKRDKIFWKQWVL